MRWVRVAAAILFFAFGALALASALRDPSPGATPAVLSRSA
jgi:hypothetical protein